MTYLAHYIHAYLGYKPPYYYTIRAESIEGATEQAKRMIKFNYILKGVTAK